MKTKTIAAASLAALAGLALFALAVANPFSTQATTQAASDGAPESLHQEGMAPLRVDVAAVSQIAQGEGGGQPQATDDETKPYIGVAISELDDGSVKVVEVLEDGPSNGLLEAGDVITAVNSVSIDGSQDLIDAIAKAGVGASITLTFTRDGPVRYAVVTVGEREVETKSAFWGADKGGAFHFSKESYLKPRGAWEDFARSEISRADEDGSYKTYRKAVGTVTNVDADAGTFTLQPKDDSDPIAYTIGEDTKVVINRTGDIGGLNSEDETLVMDVDGDVQLVQQGDQTAGFGWGKKSGFGRHMSGWGKRSGFGRHKSGWDKRGGFGRFSLDKGFGHSWGDFEDILKWGKSDAGMSGAMRDELLEKLKSRFADGDSYRIEIRTPNGVRMYTSDPNDGDM